MFINRFPRGRISKDYGAAVETLALLIGYYC